jgi:chromosome segregation ATPase
VLAQGKSDADGSLSALTAEVRQLRVAVEQLARAQTQAQALSVFLSVQQSRIAQLSTRLDSVQKELDSATARSQDLQASLAGLVDQLSAATERQTRAALEDGIRGLKAEQRGLDLIAQQARSRESDLSQALQFEESRWNDLIARLEQLMTK